MPFPPFQASMKSMILDSNILIGVLCIVCLALVADIFHLRRSLRKLFREGNHDLGSALKSLNGDIDELEKFQGEMEKYLTSLEKRVRRSTQAAEMVRFNAFKGDGVGGNQSFATAFLNEDGDGAVISSLYSRERVSIFSKPIVKFVSEIELSEEERQAVSKAKAKLTGAKS